MKLAIQFHRIGPYHIARLHGAASAEIDVIAIELSGKDETYAWDKIDTPVSFRKITVFEDHDADNMPFYKLKSGIFESLSEARPDVVAINGWSSRPALVTLLWCRINKIPSIVMSETTPWDFKRHAIKEFIKKKT